MISKFLSYYREKRREDPSLATQHMVVEVVLGLVAFVLGVLVESLLIMLLFNAVMPHLFQTKNVRINFGQALALKLLISFLF